MDDIRRIEGVTLREGNLDVVHITVAFLQDCVCMSQRDRQPRTDRGRPRRRAGVHRVADHALDHGLLRPFTEGAFHAARLRRSCSRPTISSCTAEGVVAGRLHWWGALGDVDPDVSYLGSQLDGLRGHETGVGDRPRLDFDAATQAAGPPAGDARPRRSQRAPDGRRDPPADLTRGRLGHCSPGRPCGPATTRFPLSAPLRGSSPSWSPGA